MKKPKYFIVSPARNEEKFIEHTLQSVIRQSLLPERWLIVDDGSNDNTAVIVERFCREFSWIELVSLPDRGFAKYGPGVVEAFDNGYELIKNKYFDYLVKLDCDLSFGSTYFEDIFSKFVNDSKLGIASGHTYYERNDELIWEDAPLDHTRGSCKVYLRACFEEIGGLQRTLGWDCIDEVTARMKGWTTRSYPEFRVIHHRKLGSTLGLAKGKRRQGYTNYITGYHPIYFALKTLYRVFAKPYFLGSFFCWFGFYYASLTREPRVVDRHFIRFMRKEQMQKLRKFDFWRDYVDIVIGALGKH
jgi:glycosyltransferase involved in cell wall biosynthesis